MAAGLGNRGMGRWRATPRRPLASSPQPSPSEDPPPDCTLGWRRPWSEAVTSTAHRRRWLPGRRFCQRPRRARHARRGVHGLGPPGRAQTAADLWLWRIGEGAGMSAEQEALACLTLIAVGDGRAARAVIRQPASSLASPSAAARREMARAMLDSLERTRSCGGPVDSRIRRTGGGPGSGVAARPSGDSGRAPCHLDG